MEKLEILLISNTCSTKKYAEVVALRTRPSLNPARPMFEALMEGLARKGASVTCVSALPFSARNTDIRAFAREEEHGAVTYVYQGFRSRAMFRYYDLYRGTTCEVNEWIKRTAGRKRFVICDSLVLECAHPARKAAQREGIPVVAFVTDYPSLTAISLEYGRIKRLLLNAYNKLADHDLAKYDGYILVTEGLRELIGASCSKYIVMEGITSPPPLPPRAGANSKKKVIMYCGGLYYRFGVCKLADAFSTVEGEDLELCFYGSGECREYIEKKSREDPRIRYGGIVSADEIIQLQQNAALLVNPRPSNESFAKYSFPSKTLSYILSKVPVLTTRLLGIPREYQELLFWFDDESVEGIAKTLQEVLRLPEECRREKSEAAYRYVVEHTSSGHQAGRVLSFFEDLY